MENSLKVLKEKGTANDYSEVNFEDNLMLLDSFLMDEDDYANDEIPDTDLDWTIIEELSSVLEMTVNSIKTEAVSSEDDSALSYAEDDLMDFNKKMAYLKKESVEAFKKERVKIKN